MTESQSPTITIETTLPKPWEREETFNDVLFDWMSRAPWLGISVSAHLVLYLIVQAIPWNLFDQPEETIIHATLDSPEEVIEDPPIEPDEEIIPEDVIEDPVIQDTEIIDPVVSDSEDFSEDAMGDPEFFNDTPFEDSQWNPIIGIGPGGGGKYGDRFGRGKGRVRGGGPTNVSLQAGLEWLRKHQSIDGYWSASDYASDNAESSHCSCEGGGFAHHDVGLTSLALLAFLGDGHTLRKGEYKDVVHRGIQWLRAQQDFETGQIGTRTGHDWIYNHAIATLALCEAYYFDRVPALKTNAQRAVDFITQARDPYGAWRYDVPSMGDNDTSITGWMVFALESAREAGLVVPEDAFAGALAWFDDATDSGTARVGYDDVGTPASRAPGVEHPRDGDESMTAVALLCRFFLGQTPDRDPIMERHADLLLKSLPERGASEPSRNTDFMYYWYYGSYAMYQMGGKHWDRWNKAMKAAVLDSQRKDGHAHGSWDPSGPWGHSGGRVYATATMVLCLEVYFRYGRVLGAR